MSDHANITALEEEGLVWVERIASGSATDADLAALARWRKQSKAHASALQEAIAFQRACLGLAKERAVQAVTQPAIIRPAVHKPRFARRLALGAAISIFAGAAAWAAVDPPLHLWPSIAEISADYRTEKGEQRQVLLDRMVSVQMNTMTSLSVEHVAGKSGIRLIDGEIAVTLPSAADPYTIRVNNIAVTLHGGTINIRSDITGLSVAGVDGKADIEFGHQTKTLAPRQMVRVIDGNPQPAKSVDIAPIVAWRRDILMLRNSSVAAAVQEINRYRPGMIVIGSSRLAERRINVVLQLKDIPGSLDAICRLTGARATVIGNYVVLS